MRRAGRTILIVFALLVAGVVLVWRMPGSQIDPGQFDYVKAFDDAENGCIIIVAAFDAGSFAVIDSCEHEWRGGDLTVHFRSKPFLARDGRAMRIGAFRVTYADNVPAKSPTRIDVEGRGVRSTVEVEPMPVNFTTLTAVIDSIPR